ncbi:MAG: hypothetical protein Q8P02_05400 [Candidatus Micrarchaeota archaeon]|nr:hypothetical protein [Candidatus Micrarchaeota archaeon]
MHSAVFAIGIILFLAGVGAWTYAETTVNEGIFGDDISVDAPDQAYAPPLLVGAFVLLVVGLALPSR